MDLIDRKKLKVENRILTKCCICGSSYSGAGNDAQPIEEGKCCNKCYESYVKPKKDK